MVNMYKEKHGFQLIAKTIVNARANVLKLYKYSLTE